MKDKLIKFLIVSIVILFIITASIAIFSNKKIIKETISLNSQNRLSSESIIYEWDISESDEDNVIASLKTDGTLVISGKGRMKDLLAMGSHSSWWYNRSTLEDYTTKIKSVEIQEGVENISQQAFSGCTELSNVTISSTVSIMEMWIFYECAKLNNIVIPQGVSSISFGAFWGSSISNITVEDNNPNYSDTDGILFNKDKTTIVYYPAIKTETSYTIPTTVKNIGNYAFYSADNLVEVIIPTSVNIIGNYAFNYCDNLTKIIIPSSINTIGDYAFEYCDNLTEIIIPTSVNTIGNYAFKGCNNLIEIQIPKTVEKIGNGIFNECRNLKNVNVEDENINYISENGILYDINKTKLLCYPNKNEQTTYLMPITLQSIEDVIFNDCVYLEKIEVPIDNNYFSMVDGILYNKDLTKLICCPKGNDNTKIVITQNTKHIEDGAFKGMPKLLEEIVIPASIENIPDDFLNSYYDIKVYCKENSEVFRHLLTLESERERTIKEKIEKIENTGDKVKRVEYVNNGEYMIEVVTFYTNSDGTKSPHIYYLYIQLDQYVEYVLDDENPIITSITGNPTEWTTEDVTLTVQANDTLSGLASEPYSFDGGTTWQKENTKIYTENTNEIVIQVKDNLGNIETSEVINIDKIDMEKPTIVDITGNPTEWTTEDVTLTVQANDALSGLALEPYSFDGGITWQKENTKTYTENTNGIVIQVKDNIGNITTADIINITKIRKVTNMVINTMPDKIEYLVGENLDTQGLTLKVEYSNGDSEIITQGFTCSPTIFNIIGTQKITVTYLERTITFNVEITSDNEETDEIMLNSNKYNIKDYIIKNIQPKTLLSNFKQNITTNATIIKVLDNTTELLNNDIIGTGLQLLLENKVSYTLVVKGDCNGDGQVNIQDILSINKHRLEKVQLKDEYLTASDVNEDSKADIRDILQINKYRLEKINKL